MVQPFKSPARRFAGSQNPTQFFGVTNAPKDTKWSVDDPNAPGFIDRALQSIGRTTGAEYQDPGEASMQSAAWNASNNYGSNLAAGQQVVNQRRAQMDQDYWSGRRSGGVVGGVDLGADYGKGYGNDGTPWGDYFQSLVGKEALTQQAGMRPNIDVFGIGRLKAQDVPTGMTYATYAGEVAPGLRGAANRLFDAGTANSLAGEQGIDPSRGGWWTPDEFNRIGQAGIAGLRRAFGGR